MSFLHRTLSLVNYAFIVVIAIGGLYLTYLNFYPIKIIEIENPIRVERSCAQLLGNKPVFKAGDTVPLRFKGEKYKNYIGSNYPKLVNSTVTLLPAFVNPRPVGRFNEISTSYSIPSDIKPGLYKFEFVIVFAVISTRSITYTFETEEFIVE